MESIIFTMFCILSTSAVLKIEQDRDSLTSCVVKMVEDIDYREYYHLMDITVMNMNNELKLSALHKVKGARFVSRRFFWDTDNISNRIYIVMSEDYQELKNGLSKVTSDALWNPSARFIFVLQTYENLRDTTELLQAYNIFHNVSLIFRHGDAYAIYKYNFEKPDFCLKTGQLKFWSWCSDYHTEKNLTDSYRGRIRNCRYKFLSRNIWPLVNFDTSYKGTEQYCISLYQKYSGVKIDLQEFTKVDRYGSFMSNSTVIMLQKVVTNEVEGVLGGYEISSAYAVDNISHSYPITIDHMFFILSHANHLGQWVAVLRQSFNTCVMIVFLFVIFCVAATMLSIFSPRKDVSRDTLIIFGYILNTTAVKRPESGWPQALIFSSLLFMALIIPYAIQANLCSVTTRPVRGYEPKRPEDLKPYQAVFHTDWQHRFEFDGHKDCGTRLNCLMKVKHEPTKSLYTVVSMSHFKVYQWRLADNNCRMAMYRLKEPYGSIYRTVYLRRGSVLLHDLDRFILRFSSTGLMRKRASDIFHKEWMNCKSRFRPRHLALPLSNFYYVFMILIGGYCVSSAIFIYELWTGSRRKE